MTTVNGFYRKFMASLLLHGIMLGCVACLWTRHPVAAIPIFQTGEFSLDFIPDSASLPVAPAMAVIPPPPVVTESPAPASVEEPEEPEETIEALEPDEDQETLQLVSEIPPPPVPAPTRTPSPVSDRADARPQPATTPLPGTVNPGVTGAPRLESSIRPIYPPGARLRGEEGVVTVCAVVTPSGKADSADVVRSSGYSALDQAAVNAVRRARFIPARNGRQPVESQTTLTFRFTLVD